MEGIDRYFEHFREVGFEKALHDATQMANDLGVEPRIVEKRNIKRKRQLHEESSEDETRPDLEKFRTNYFLFIIDNARSSFKSRFKEFEVYKQNFGFLFDLEKACSNDELLKNRCLNLEDKLKYNVVSDVNGNDLFIELRYFRMILPKEVKKTIGKLNYMNHL